MTPAPEQSLAQVVAGLPASEREKVLAGLDPEALQYDPQFWLRPTQLRPINEVGWSLCVFVAGRGTGKTRTMSEWIRHKAMSLPKSRGALVARTAADTRDVVVTGESGILAMSPPSERPEYEPSKRLLTWPNGTTALLFTSEAPDQLRGPQFHWTGCIAAGEMVLTTQGPVPIENVTTRMWALNRFAPMQVMQAGLTRTDAEVLRLVSTTGRTVRLTPDHRVWTENRTWVEAKDLLPGNVLVTPEGIADSVERVEPGGTADVYDLTMKGRPEFFVNGILVHNCDEVASWSYLPDDSGLNAWDNVRLATRLGENPQIFAATTPKRTVFMRQLLQAAESEEHVLLLRGKTTDNAGNLSRAYLDTIYGLYEGTALARQELEGVMLDDAEGALWTEELLDENRLDLLPSLRRPLVVVGVDPAVSEKGGGDTTGIVVAVTDGSVPDLYRREAYVLEDLSVAASPQVWANVVVHASRRYQAPVVVETNQGGGLIRSTIQGVDPTIKVIDVHSRQGKSIRAEPVVLAYEQHRVHHVGYFADLETQMTTWLPSETRSKSPDRLDALVHALTALLVKPPEGLSGGTIRAKSPTRIRPPVGGAARRSRGRVLLPFSQPRSR